MLARMSTFSLIIVLFFHSSVLAHEGKPHLMGTVTALDAQHMIVQTKAGKTISIVLKKETQYRKGETAVSGADLKVGDRVVVETTGEKDTLTAREIRFSPGGAAGSSQAMPHHGMGKGREK